MTMLQTEIERRLADSEPEIEVLLAEVAGGRCLRVFIDHPDGVTLAMCERVTLLLERSARALLAGGLLARQRAPADQARALPALRRAPRPRAHASPRPIAQLDGERAGGTRPVRSFTGELVGASEEEVTLAADGGVIAIPYSEIHRSNLIEE